MTNELNLFSLNAVVPAARKEPVPSAVGARPAETNKVSEGQTRLEESRQAEDKPKREDLASTVQDLNDLAQELHRELRFSVDEDSGETVIKVVDQQTDKVIRQIPSEEVLQLRRRMEEATGAIFRDSA